MKNNPRLGEYLDAIQNTNRLFFVYQIGGLVWNIVKIRSQCNCTDIPFTDGLMITSIYHEVLLCSCVLQLTQSVRAAVFAVFKSKAGHSFVCNLCSN